MLASYGLVLAVLVVMEGILSADNALVLAVMVKHLPERERRKALFYGLVGALVLRFGALFLISFLAEIWQMQALGAIYLMIIALLHLRQPKTTERSNDQEAAEGSDWAFWLTVAKVELADVAFAVDSILAAVALAMTLPPAGLGHIGGLDTGRFMVVFAGGIIGLLIMRFAANVFVGLLQRRPGLEQAAFMVVFWVGVKLAVMTMAHPQVGLIAENFPHSLGWKAVFYGVLMGLLLWGWFSSRPQEERLLTQVIRNDAKK